MGCKFVVLLFVIAAVAPVLTLPSHAQAIKYRNSVGSAKREAWMKSMKQTSLPGGGCFEVSYPNTAWQKTACVTAPHIPVVPGYGSGSQAVGDANDFVAQVSSGLISTVSGAFNASNVTSESGYIDNTPPAYANSFTLQLNSNFFADPPACSGAANPSICQGWQQFVVEEDNGGNAVLFMQYWLVNYGPTCPGGWTGYNKEDCYLNSAATGLPSFPASSIPEMDVTGQAENGTDTAMFGFSEPTELYAVSQNDNVLDLEQYWIQAEFNVFGDGKGGEANFNGDSTFIVDTSVDNGTGDTTPVCVGPQLAQATAETNNLTLTPQSAPVCCSYGGSIQFAESNASGVGAACGDGGLQVDGNFTATPTSEDGTETVITHPIIEGETRVEYSATLEDSSPDSTITYQLLNSCGQSLGTGNVSSGTTIFYLNIEKDGESCTYGVRGTMYATSPGYLQSFTSTIRF